MLKQLWWNSPCLSENYNTLMHCIPISPKRLQYEIVRFFFMQVLRLEPYYTCTYPNNHVNVSNKKKITQFAWQAQFCNFFCFLENAHLLACFSLHFEKALMSFRSEENILIKIITRTEILLKLPLSLNSHLLKL